MIVRDRDSNRRIHIRSWVTAAAFSFGMSTLALAAGGGGFLGRDDLDFARALVEAGMPELGQKVCDAVAADATRSSDDRIEAAGVRVDLAMEVAMRERNMEKRVELLKDALSARKKFLADNAGSSAAEKMGAQGPRTYLMLGDSILNAVKAEKDEAKAATLRDLGRELLKEGLKSVNARITELEPLRDNEATAAEYAGAVFDAARIKYFRAMLNGPKDVARETELEDVIRAFGSFSIAHGDQLAAYEGFVLQGLCEIELGRPDDAIDNFTGAINLRDAYEVKNGRFIDMEPATVNLIAAATIERGKLQGKLAKVDEARETFKEFLDKMPSDADPEAFMLIKISMAETLNQAGASDEAAKLAQSLVDADPNGYFGARARELLSAGGGGATTLGASDLARVAEQQASRNTEEDFQAALETIRKARAMQTAVAGSPAETDLLMLMGRVQAARGMFHEAVTAFDLVAQFGDKESIPDALSRAVQIDIQLYAQEKKAFYQKRNGDRLRRLSSEFPNHPASTYARFFGARQLEAEKKFLEAADAYSKMEKGTPSYEESLFRAGYCYQQELDRVHRESKDKKADVSGLATKAEQMLKLVIDSIEPARKATLDTKRLASLDKISFDARVSLASLYLHSAVNRDKDALPVIDAAEVEAKDDTERVNTIWRLRMQGLRALGKLDEAEKALETLMKRAPDSKATGVAAGMLARDLDTNAKELRDKNPNSPDLPALNAKIARYYIAAVNASLSGRSSISVSDTIKIIDRVYDLAFDLNNLPLDVSTFLGVDRNKLPKPELFQQLAELYKRALERGPSYRAEARLARCYGFLGRWEDVNHTLQRLFENENFVSDQRSVSKAVYDAKPELMNAWVEWGYAEREIGIARNDLELTNHARFIAEVVCRSLTPTKYEMWWRGKYLQIRCLLDAGAYDQADVALRDLERSTNDFDEGKYGLRDGFKEMAKEAALKASKNKGSTPPPPAKDGKDGK